jgi:hypothetical protein
MLLASTPFDLRDLPVKTFSLGAALLNGAWLASVLRTRLLHRVLLLPSRRILIAEQQAKELGLPLW